MEVIKAMINLHPGIILLVGAFLALILRQQLLRQGIMILAPALALVSLLNIRVGTSFSYNFINDMELIILKVDRLSWLFGLIFCIVALVANIYALHVKRRGENVAGLAYAGCSLGVVFAGDWITMIFFWEVMAVASVLLIWNRKVPEAIKAGFRYILVHFFGGNLLLAGIFLKVSEGQIEITSLTNTNDAAFWLILLGISINAAIPPLHAWLTDAYPEGTVSGSVFLSAFTTKVAVYALIRIFSGTEFLIWAGVIMALYGVVYAVLENDIRRLLAYHIVSQVGYMVAAVGMGTYLALDGAAAHAFSHILYKSLLFMGAGAVIYATGKRKLTDLGGLWHKMPLVVILYMIGAFSISGVPLFNGFISKSMIISAAASNGMLAVEALLYLASIGTFLSIALKLPYFMFFGPDRGIEPKKLPTNMIVAMVMGASLCILYGVMPSLLYQYLPFGSIYQPFTIEHVISTVQLLVATFAAFWIFIPRLGGKHTISIDTDWFYRKPLVYFVNFLIDISYIIRFQSGILGNRLIHFLIPFFTNPLKWLKSTKDEPAWPVYSGNKYRFPIGTTILMTIIVCITVYSFIWLT
jgi:multicomponent Na+:H+ antiporter subunit D